MRDDIPCTCCPSSHAPGQLSLIGQSGATSIRDDVSWDHIEMEKDHLVMPSGSTIWSIKLYKRTCSPC